MTEEQRAIESARIAVRAAAMRDKLRSEGRDSEAEDVLFEEVVEHILTQGREALIRHQRDLDARASDEGVPRFDVVRGRRHGTASPSRQKLRNVIDAWETGKLIENGGQTRHIHETKRGFALLIDVVGNKPISQLTAADFRKFFDHVMIGARTRSARWYMRHLPSCNPPHILSIPTGLAAQLELDVQLVGCVPRLRRGPAQPIEAALFTLR